MEQRRGDIVDGGEDTAPIILNEPCSICGVRESAVKARRSSKPLCVLHYFTTTAPHRKNNAPPHTILSDSVVADQKLEVQDIFATAFVELQQEIQKQQKAKHQSQPNPAPAPAVPSDPLAILSRWHGGKKKNVSDLKEKAIQKKKKRKQPPSTSNEGGFLRPVPLPREIVQTQQAQMNKQHALTQRITNSPQHRSKKKKAAPKSVWHVNPYSVPSSAGLDVASFAAEEPAVPKCSSCSAPTDVVVMRTNQRKQDMGVAETWSNKDRDDDVATTYQCHGCGKIWTEQE